MAEMTFPAKIISPATRSQAPFGAWGLRAAALTYLVVLVAIPFIVIAFAGFQEGLTEFWEGVTRPAAVSAIWLTVWTAAIMTVINIVMGTITAYAAIRWALRTGLT